MIWPEIYRKQIYDFSDFSPEEGDRTKSVLFTENSKTLLFNNMILSIQYNTILSLIEEKLSKVKFSAKIELS